MVRLLTIERADGRTAAYVENGIVPLGVQDFAKASVAQAPIFFETSAFDRLVPLNIGTAPILDDWLTSVIDYDDPIRVLKIGRHRTITARVHMVP